MSAVGGYLAEIIGFSLGKSATKETPGLIVSLRAVAEANDAEVENDGRVNIPKGATFSPLDEPIDAEAAIWLSEKSVTGKAFRRQLDALGYDGPVEAFLRGGFRSHKVPKGQRAVVVCEAQQNGGKTYENWRILWPRKGPSGMNVVSADDLDLSSLADMASGTQPTIKDEDIPF